MNTKILLHGGLGNQMFGWAFGRSLSLELGADLFIDDSVLAVHKIKRELTLDIFPNIELNRVDNKGLVADFVDFSVTYSNTYIDEIFKELDGKSIETLNMNGYFQSKKLFEKHLDVIKKDFELPKRALKDNAVSLQVRRGDYVGNEFHEVCTIDYYNKAIEMMKSKLENPTFYIISEDPEWVIKNLQFGELNYEIPERKSSKFERDDFETMMSCDFHIISNSSFGWWPAILAAREVISPSRWYPDKKDNEMIQSNWITIET
jgi:hypothetical protein